MHKRLYILLLCLLLLTPLRAAFILVAPLVVYVTFNLFFERTFNKRTRMMTALFLASTLIGLLFFRTTSISNVLLSLWIVYPILFFLFAKINNIDDKVIRYFIQVSSIIILIIDLLGIILGFVLGFYSDFMTRSYGSHFAGMNGLAILNAIYLLYYINKYKKTANIKAVIYALFFALGVVVCECGLVLVCFILALVVIYSLRLKIIYVPLLVVFVFSIVYFISYVSQDYEYYKNTLSLLMDKDIWEYNFRKIMVFINYKAVLEDNPMSFILGNGPGSYNSRIAFLLNDDAQNPFTAVFGHSMPVYHSLYVYPLWDQSEVNIEAFNDGSRNKPFSSFLSIISEYGIIMFILVSTFFVGIYNKYKNAKLGESGFIILFITVFMLLMLLLDQWLETSEMFYILLLLKILDIDIANSEFNEKNTVNTEVAVV